MKTNIFRYSFSLLALLVAVVSCDDKQPDEKPEEIIPVFPEAVNKTVAAGESVDLSFETNMEWKVEISGEGKGNLFWLDDAGMTATSISSKKIGPQTVTVVFSDKEEFDKNRVCEVTLHMGGESKKIATYTRPSLERTFEVYVGVPGEFGFNEASGAYVYSETVAKEASLSTFPGEVEYYLPIKVVTNYAWQLVPPSWISCETMSGNIGTTEILLNVDLSMDIADGKTEVIRFVDVSNNEAAFEVELTMPAFRDRVETTVATTFNFDINGLVENLNGSFIEIPAFFELLSTSQTQVKVLDWNENEQYYGTSFSEWPEVTRTIYEGFAEGDALAKYSVEFKVGANETYEDKYADIFVIPASKASVALEDWFDAGTGNLKDEFKSYIVGRLCQPGLERDYITLSEGVDAELAKYTEDQWWAADLATENIFELVYKDEYSYAVLVFDESFASFKYFDYDFAEVKEDDVEDFWLQLNTFSSNKKGRVVMYPEKFDVESAEFPESFIVFYDKEENVLGALSCRYTKKSSVVTGEVLALTDGEAEFVKLDEESEMKMSLSSEYGQEGELEVYQLSTSDLNVAFSSQVEAWGHKILKVTDILSFAEYSDAPFQFENIATDFTVSMGEEVTDKVEAVILLQEQPNLYFAAVHYIYTPAGTDVEPENPGTDPEDPGEEPEVPEDDPDYEERGTMIYSIGGGTGKLMKYSVESDRYKAINAKFGLTEVYHLISGDRMVLLSGDEVLTGLTPLDPSSLEESSETEVINFEGTDAGFNIYLRGTQNAEALVLVEGEDGYIAAVYVTYDVAMGIPSPFSFTNPDAVAGTATLTRCTGDALTAALEMFNANANFDERNIYELRYIGTDVKATITVPSDPVFNAAWGNESNSTTYWLTHTMSGSKKMTVTMKKSGETDYFVWKTSDGMWSWVLVCTCE